MMRIAFARPFVVAAAIVAPGLMATFTAAPASADSLSCEISGSISLFPGLSETPTVQSVKITNPGAKLTNCTGAETIVTGGFLWVKGTFAERTKEAITCQALKGPGAALEPRAGPGSVATFRWHPKIPGDRFSMSGGFVNVPITEMSVSLSGAMSTEFPEAAFQGDKITGSVTEKYSGTCGGSPPGADGPARRAAYHHGKTKGTFTGTIAIS